LRITNVFSIKLENSIKRSREKRETQENDTTRAKELYPIKISKEFYGAGDTNYQLKLSL